MLARGRRRQPSRFNVLAQPNVGLLLAHVAFLVGRAAPWKHLAARLHSGKVAPPPPVRRIPAAELLAKCRAALSDAGLDEGACGPVAASIVAAQRDGKAAHGLGRLNAMVAHPTPNSSPNPNPSSNPKPNPSSKPNPNLNLILNPGPNQVASVASGEVFGQAKPSLAMSAPAVVR